jgi:FRG domain-containing protein
MTETVGSWRELDEAIADSSWARHQDRVRPTVVWRGLSRSSYSHMSSLARLSGDFARLERHLIRNFRKYAHREAPGPTMWDWLSLAQHHGLPTRLLDWTFSPLVALHFASATWSDDEAILLAIDCDGAHESLPGRARALYEQEGSLVFTTEMLAELAPDLDAFDGLSETEPFVVFFEPPSLDERIVNQAAVLSAISDPSCHMEQWMDEHPSLWRAWLIPPEVKAEVRDRLDQAHVNERVLMPGLDGLAAWLRRYYSPRRAPAEDLGGATMEAR